MARSRKKSLREEFPSVIDRTYLQLRNQQKTRARTTRARSENKENANPVLNSQ